MSDLKELTDALVAFRDARNWEQFHNSKDLAVALGIEAAELNELFLWKSPEACEKVNEERIKEELADVLAYALLLANKHGFDVKKMVLEKIGKNGRKYPVEKSRNIASKYTDL